MQTKISVEEIAKELSIQQAISCLKEIEKTVKSQHIDSTKSFFSEKNISYVSKQIGFSDEIEAMLIEALPFLLKNEFALHFGALLHLYLFQTDISLDTKAHNFCSLPKLPIDILGKDAGFFYAFVLLSGYAILKEHHTSRGIPHNIIQDTLLDLELWIKKHTKRKGVAGFSEKHWLYAHFLGMIFKLGRLQFRFENFPSELFAFRNSLSKETIMIVSKKDIAFRKDGQYDGS